MKKQLLIVGCGDVASRVVPLARHRYRIFALIRDPSKAVGLREQGVIPLLGDLSDRKSLHRLGGLADEVLYLAPPLLSGVKSADLHSQNLLAALSGGRLPRRLVYISTSGVYGDYAGQRINETARLGPVSDRAKRRVMAEQQLRGWGRRQGVAVNILRTPGIYAVNRLPLSRLQQRTPCVQHEQDSYSNHIHADDLAVICLAALRYGRAGRIYHACDDDELKMGEYFDMVADAFHLSRPARISHEQAQLQLSPGLLSFLNESRRLDNQRLKQELKITLRYPHVADFLATINQ